MNELDHDFGGISDRLAEAFRLFSNRKVVKILAALQHNEMTLSAIATELATDNEDVLPWVLTLQRESVLVSQRRGKRIYFSVKYPEILEALDLVRVASVRRLQRTAAVTNIVPLRWGD